MKLDKSIFLSKIIGGTACFFAAAFPSVIFSCADSTPSLAKAIPSVILDYKDEQNVPAARFALFVRTNSDNRRADNFTVKSLEDPLKLEWKVSNPKIVTMDNQEYIFAESLSTADSSPFKKGLYKIVYTDAAGQETETSFRLDYREELFSIKSPEIRSELGNVMENIVVYNEFNMIIYIGKKKSTWKDDAGILKDYKAAAYTRTVYFSDDYKIVCLMPVSKIEK